MENSKNYEEIVPKLVDFHCNWSDAAFTGKYLSMFFPHGKMKSVNVMHI